MVVAVLAATVLLVRAPRVRAGAMLGALIARARAAAGRHLELAPAAPRPPPPAVGGVGGAGRWWRYWWRSPRSSARRPGLVAVLAVLALPFRVPIESGGNTSNLLVPLYFVVAAGVLAWISGCGGPRCPRPPRPPRTASPRRDGLLVWVDRLLALSSCSTRLQGDLLAPAFDGRDSRCRTWSSSTSRSRCCTGCCAARLDPAPDPRLPAGDPRAGRPVRLDRLLRVRDQDDHP